MEWILNELKRKYFSGNITLEYYALTSIFFHSGRCSSQIISLKVRDIIRWKNNDVSEYIINFPIGKQQHTRWRQEFYAYPITEDLWHLLDLYSVHVIDRIQRITGLRLESNIIASHLFSPTMRLLSKA
jgi:hypothetical protein